MKTPGPPLNPLLDRDAWWALLDMAPPEQWDPALRHHPDIDALVRVVHAYQALYASHDPCAALVRLRTNRPSLTSEPFAWVVEISLRRSPFGPGSRPVSPLHALAKKWNADPSTQPTPAVEDLLEAVEPIPAASAPLATASVEEVRTALDHLLAGMTPEALAHLRAARLSAALPEVPATPRARL